MRNLQLTGELLRLLRLFQEEKIFAVPFKGPVLSQRLYGNVGNRIYGDLDILVAADVVPHVVELMVGQGYQPEIQLPLSAYSFYVKHENNLTLVKQESNVTVEIHWEITGPYLKRPLQISSLIEGLDVLELNGHSINVLGLEDLLLYLCVHGAKHRWERLEWICSVGILILHNSWLDWDAVLNRAQSWCCKRMLYLGLFLVSDLFGVQMPPDVWKRISMDEQVRSLAEKTYELIFPLHKRSKPVGNSRFSGYHLQVRDNGADTLSYAMRLLFRPTINEWQAWPLPGVFTPLYYGLRPLRLAWEGLTRTTKV